MSIILNSTEESIVSHTEAVTINSHKKGSNQPSIPTALPTQLKTSRAKRSREDITTSTTTSLTKPAVKRNQKNAPAVESLGSQTTLSQYENLAPVVSYLANLQSKGSKAE